MLGASGGVGEQGSEFFGEGFGVEAVLEELGNDAAAGDEVGHGDGEVAFAVDVGGDFLGIPDELLGELEGEGGHAVDDDERVADERGLDGGGAAGNDGGAGVVEGFAGVGDEVDVGEGEVGVGTGKVRDPARGEVGEAGAGFTGGEGRGYGEEVLRVAGEAAGHLHHSREIALDFAPATAGQEGDPGLGGVEVVVGGVGFAGDGGQG